MQFMSLVRVFMVGIQFTAIRIFFQRYLSCCIWVLIVDILVDDMADVVDRTNLGCPSGLFHFRIVGYVGYVVDEGVHGRYSIYCNSSTFEEFIQLIV